MSILDVGCGTGILIKTLSQLGFPYPIGIDPYISQSQKSLNYSVEKVDIVDFNPEKLFDLVMLHHSFEHMANPNEVLEAIFKLLKFDGICIIRIPVSDSYAFNHYKENWVQLDAPRHNFLHTTKGLEICVQKNGFQIETIIDDSTDFQIIGSEQYKKNIALTEKGTYFVPLFQKFFGKKRTSFTKSEIASFREIAKKLRLEGKGDQKAFVLKKRRQS
jgi:SAM-dependent methyltransferase